MFNEPFLSLRRFSEYALMLLLAGCLCAGAHAQATPTIVSFAAGLNPGSGSSAITPGTIPNIAVDTFGDVLAVDDLNGALYEYPANGGNAVTLVANGGLFSTKGASVITPGIAIDPLNDLYIEGGSCVLMYPYDGVSGTWDGLAALTTNNTSASVCGTAAPTFINLGAGVLAWGIAIDYTNTSLLIGTSSSSGNSIVSIPVSGDFLTAPAAGTPATIVSGMQAPAISIASDLAGNIYFVEQGSGALPGAYEIPAGTTGLTTDAKLTRIDPNLPAVTGVATDDTNTSSLGNTYISDNKDGVYLLPQGFTSSSSALLLTSVPAQGAVALYRSGNLFVPTQQFTAGVSEVAFNAAEFGSFAVGAAKPDSGSVVFSFNNASGVTPGTIEVLEAGKSNPDFAVVSSTGPPNCVTQAQATSLPTNPLPYAAQTGCTVNLTFSPQTTGAVSATLTMLDTSGNLIASMPLSGIGTGGAVQVTPAAQSTIGGGLTSPQQIAVDAAGNLYVADSGLGAVEMYPSGSGAGATATAVGQNLKAPTGVAVDGAGDVFIADSGNVYEVPETANGLNSKGQVTLKSGLGSQVALAADGLGDLYVSDASNQKVYELEDLSAGLNAGLPPMFNSQVLTLSGAAFSTPSAIAVDSQSNLYVVNGGAVYEVTPAGTQTQVLTGLSDVTGLAIDPSGSVYVSASGGTVRIPDVSGTLNATKETTVASGVTNPTSVAIDSEGNVYLADGTALDLNLTSASASLNFGTLTADPTSAPPPSGSSSSQTVTLLNYGNVPLQVTGYNSPLNSFEPSTSLADFTETADTCSGNSVPVDSTCTATITFSPAIGDGGTLTGQVLVEGNVGNSPVGVNGAGVAPTLAGTTITMTASSTGTIEGVPVTATVAPNASGSSTPTGTVTLTVAYGNNVPLTNPSLPTKYQLTATLNSSGVATFDPTQLPIANYTFTARYNGDPTYLYGNSSNTAAVAVATPVPVTLTQPAASASSLPQLYSLPCTSGSGSGCTTSYNYDQPSGNPPGYLVLAEGNGSEEDYSGDWTKWDYSYPVTIASASGDPMIATAVYSGSEETGWNYGAVNYVAASGQSVCGANAGSKSIVNVDDTGAAPLSVSCFTIDTSNNTVPDIMTYYAVTPEYSGTYNDLQSVNPNYESAKGQSVGFWALSHPMVQIGASPASLTVSAGSSVSTALTLNSILGYGYAGRASSENNYALPLALQCQGLPAYASCSFSYPTPNASDPNFITNPAGLECATSTAANPTYCAIDVGPNPGAVSSHASSTTPCGAVDGCLGPGAVTMTITTNVSVGTTTSKLETHKGGITFAAMFGLGLFGLVIRRKAARWGQFLMVICVLLFGGAFVGITACSTTTLGTESTAAVTPAGSYWVTVTAQETGSIAISCTSGNNCVNGIELVPGSGTQMSLPYTVNVTIGQ
ncbi:MAG: hypothetical protein ACLQHF_00515 [Terracidiphilus sp.]